MEELRPLASLQLGRYMVTAVHVDVKNPVGPVVSSCKVGELVDIIASDGMLDMETEDWETWTGRRPSGGIMRGN